MTDKVVVITGGSRGIGRATAIAATAGIGSVFYSGVIPSGALLVSRQLLGERLIAHVAAGYTGWKDEGQWSHRPYLGIGMETHLNERWAILAEYLSPRHPAAIIPYLDIAGDNPRTITGPLSLGARLNSRRASAGLMLLFNPARLPGEKLILIPYPMVSFGYRF